MNVSHSASGGAEGLSTVVGAGLVVGAPAAGIVVVLLGMTVFII